MRVTVVGAGHSGFAMAAHLAYCGHSVTLWNRASTPTLADIARSREIAITGLFDETVHLHCVTTDMEEALRDSELILVTVTSNAHKEVAVAMAPYLRDGIPVILNPGRTFGAIEVDETLRSAGCKAEPRIAEMQTIIYTCRKLNGHTVQLITLKRGVHIFELPHTAQKYGRIIHAFPPELQGLLILARSMAITSFGNVGMLLHCAPTLLNSGWVESRSAQFKYYYEGISSTIAGLLERMDVERLCVASALGEQMETLKDWLQRVYKISGTNVFECIKNNPYYETIDAPKSLNHRYIFEDIPCGLVPTEDTAKQLGINTPAISAVLDLAAVLLQYDFRVAGRKLPLASIQRNMLGGI